MVSNLSSTILLCSALCALGCGGGDGDGPDAATGGSDASARPDARTNVADAAGTSDALSPVDARPAALDCLGEALPTVGANPLSISGTAYNPGIPGITQDTPVVGAAIDSFQRGTDTNPIASTTSTSGGAYTLTAANASMMPMDAYLRSVASGYWTTYLYPSRPVAANQTGIQVIMTTTTQFNLLSSLASVTPDPSKGFITLLVLDCNGDPVEGAVVSTAPATTDVVYMGSGGTPSVGASATAADGIALLFNVPTDTVELRANVMSMNLRAHTVVVKPTNHEGSPGDESVMTTIIQP